MTCVGCPSANSGVFPHFKFIRRVFEDRFGVRRNRHSKKKCDGLTIVADAGGTSLYAVAHVELVID